MTFLSTKFGIFYNINLVILYVISNHIYIKKYDLKNDHFINIKSNKNIEIKTTFFSVSILKPIFISVIFA
jgi:hypothetical protein